MDRRQLGVLSGVVGALLLLLAFHFTIVVLYNSRPNPIKRRHDRFITAYMTPLFAQDWHLFAPSPISFDVILMLKTRLRHRTTAQLYETDWVDVTTPILRQLHRRRFSSLGSLAHIHVYTVFAQRLPPSQAEVYRLICENVKEHPICKGEPTDSMKRSAALAEQLRTRVASAHAFKLYGARWDIVQMKVRTLIRRVPPFSRRYDRDESRALTYMDSEWLHYQPTHPFN